VLGGGAEGPGAIGATNAPLEVATPAANANATTREKETLTKTPPTPAVSVFENGRAVSNLSN
jgi:hypothetical protein